MRRWGPPAKTQLSPSAAEALATFTGYYGRSGALASASGREECGCGSLCVDHQHGWIDDALGVFGDAVLFVVPLTQVVAVNPRL